MIAPKRRQILQKTAQRTQSAAPKETQKGVLPDMYYIVLDLEWNQPWPGSPSAQKQLPVPIHGEIIQIPPPGAVLEDLKPSPTSCSSM